MQDSFPTHRSHRRALLKSGALGMIAASTVFPVITHAQWRARTISMEVWKDPNCGCCVDWIDHMEQHGFRTSVRDEGNAAARARLGLPRKYGSCHTAVVDGYVIEGHVPASDVQRLLRERPVDALGLAVPGMPIGSPGMDGPAYKGRRDPYDVVLVMKDGSSRVYRKVV